MLRSFLQYIRFLSSLIRFGRLTPKGEDFNQARAEYLAGLQDYTPADHPIRRIKRKSNHIKRTSIFQYLMGQAAFIKSAFKLSGGHLTATSLSLSYIRIPKSASTSAGLLMLQKMYSSLEQKPLSERQINFLVDVNLLFRTNANDQLTYFTIVRNPFTRLVSVYHDFFETPNSHFIYSDYLFGVLPQSLSFSEFVKRVSTIPDRLKDQHLKPQHYFLKYYLQKSMDVRILRLEDSENIADFLNSYSLQLPHQNKSETSYNYKDYYTPESLQLAYEIYSTDIEKFGYLGAYNELNEYTKSRSKS